MSTVGVINKMIPFSAVDGPGNRSAIFLQGCNLDCAFCHNPETINPCTHCGACVDACPYQALDTADGEVLWLEEECRECDACIAICPHSSSPKTLRLTAQEVFDRLGSATTFIRGLTVSGGESTLQPEFVTALFLLAKERSLSTFLDSNGTYPFRESPALLNCTDAVMLDVKVFDDAEHQQVIGASNAKILDNLTFLGEQGKLYEVRTVIVPGLFSVDETVRQIAQIISQWDGVRYKLIRYRPIGVRKEYNLYPSPSNEQMNQLKELAHQQGVKDVVIV